MSVLRAQSTHYHHAPKAHHRHSRRGAASPEPPVRCSLNYASAELEVVAGNATLMSAQVRLRGRPCHSHSGGTRCDLCLSSARPWPLAYRPMPPLRLERSQPRSTLRRPTTSLILHRHTVQQDQFRAVELLHRIRAGHPPNEWSEFGWHQDLPSQPSAETQRDDEGICHLGAGRSFPPGAVGERRLLAVHGGTISLPVGSRLQSTQAHQCAGSDWDFAGLGEYLLEITHEPIAGHRALHQHAAPIQGVSLAAHKFEFG